MKDKKEVLEFKTRKKIFDIILKYPGLHLRELIRFSNLSEGTLRYHLKYLLKNGIILEKSNDNFVRYYIKDNIGVEDKKILHFLRQNIPRSIILYLLANAFVSQIELSKDIGKHPTTIEFHLQKLIDANIIEEAPLCEEGVLTSYKKLKLVIRKPVGKEKIYRLKNPYEVYDIFVKYKSKLLDNETTKLIFNICEFYFDRVIPESQRDAKSTEERFMELIMEIFPIPFCA